MEVRSWLALSITVCTGAVPRMETSALSTVSNWW